jgi:hypothetical protein
MSHWLSLEDLFVAGIGFDLAGALLLARGLLVDPREFVRRASSAWGVSSVSIGSQANNRIDASFGAAGLVVGFLLQATGYEVTLARGARVATSGGGEPR